MPSRGARRRVTATTPSLPLVLALAVVAALGAIACKTSTVDVPRVSATGATPSSPAPNIYSPASSGGSSSGAGVEPPTGPSPASGVDHPRAALSGSIDGAAVNLSFDQVSGYPLFEPPDGVASISWLDLSGNSLTFGADHLFHGTQRTGGDKGVSLEIGTGQPYESFVSGNGTCRVTITTLNPHGLAGSFACKGVEGSSGGRLDATGTFAARIETGA